MTRIKVGMLAALVARLVAGGIAAAALAPSAHAQWTVVNLHPAGATESMAFGVDGGQQVGVAAITAPACGTARPARG